MSLSRCFLMRYFFLFFFIFLEGFYTLSFELISIRKLIPYAGNTTEIISIIISAVLLPLSFGYYYGGKIYKEKLKKSLKTKIKHILIKNILGILFISTIGLSGYFLDFWFFHLKELNILVSTSLYSIIFISIPSFLLGQTAPLISNFYSNNYISVITGKILFVSTIGSFLGSILTTVLLMNLIGVTYTFFFTQAILILLLILLQKRFLLPSLVYLALLFYISSSYKNTHNIIYENAYNSFKIEKLEDGLVINLNNSFSSFITDRKPHSYFGYINYINDVIGHASSEEPLEILVIGAGGFTIGNDDVKNIYTFIDIDKDIKKASENFFLKKELEYNKRYIAADIRTFNKDFAAKYDIVILDAYTNKVNVPSHLITADFFIYLKKMIKDNGYIIVNFVCDPFKEDTFSNSLDATFSHIFPYGYKQVIHNGGFKKKDNIFNNIYVRKNIVNKVDEHIYTDDLNNFIFHKKF